MVTETAYSSSYVVVRSTMSISRRAANRPNVLHLVVRSTMTISRRASHRPTVLHLAQSNESHVISSKQLSIFHASCTSPARARRF